MIIFMRKTCFLVLAVCLLHQLIVPQLVVDAKSSSGTFFPRQRAALLPLFNNGKVIEASSTTSTLDDGAIVTNHEHIVRGGSTVKLQSDLPTPQEIKGVISLILIEVAFRKAFKAYNLRFPAQLAGCVALFVAMILAQSFAGKGDIICQALSPGASLLAKWVSVFFVPGLTMLPASSAVASLSSSEMVKALGVVVVGFFYSLSMVTYSVLAVRKLLGSVDDATSSSSSKSAKGTTGSSPKPYATETLQFLFTGAIISGVVSIAATRQNLFVDYQKPLETIFLLLATLASFVWGARLPTRITQIANPLVTSALVTLGVVRLLGLSTGRTMIEVLKGYTCKKLAPSEAGAGDLLLFLLSPSVISFAVGMYKGRKLIASNLAAILTGVTVGSVGSLFGTAAACRLIQLGGPKGALLRLAAVPRSTQTALGMIIAEMLGGDVAIAATLIVLTGIFGGMVGVKTLDWWAVKDPVSRGLGIGSAGLSLGVVSIKQEPEAFAFAGICLVLTAVSATCLASIPEVADLLIRIAGGTVEAAAA